MNDFSTIVLAFGRGIIKLLISVLTGFGVALLVIGISTAGKPDVWRGPPPGELLMGIGSGLLSGGAMLLALFFLPWFLKRPAAPNYLEEPPLFARPAAPRSVRLVAENEGAPVRPPRPDPNDGIPIARPAPPREEPGNAGFFEK